LWAGNYRKGIIDEFLEGSHFAIDGSHSRKKWSAMSRVSSLGIAQIVAHIDDNEVK
jgi:hypothetical protein